jgi:hypothetical protein
MPSFGHKSSYGPLKAWVVFEIDTDGIDSLDATFDTLAESLEYVRSEINRIHEEIAEDTLPFNQFEQCDNVDKCDQADAIISSVDEHTELNKITLARGSNGEIQYSWIVYRLGWQPMDD